MPDNVTLVEDNLIEILSYWGVRPGQWMTVGVVTGDFAGVARPIIEIGGQRYVLRKQPPDLTENDTRFRHAFMRSLAAQGLPVPQPLTRPEGYSYATVTEGIYELQTYLAGEPFLSGEPETEDWIASAGATLGTLHQASADFRWEPHLWPEERSASAIAQAYVRLLQERGESDDLPPALAAGLVRVALECSERLDDAAQALGAGAVVPSIHIHGDYQPHNLGFTGERVSAIYDFDAAHWELRVYELAYSLLYFTGARWDANPSVTPPLVDDGLNILDARRYLDAYGREAPPAEGEAQFLGDALALAFPVALANGVLEDLIFPDDFSEPPDEEDALARLDWASRFWLWLDRYRSTLAEVWNGA